LLRRKCDPERLPFETTAELVDFEGELGQERAVGALHFGLGIRREGYHLFVMGPEGSGRHTLARRHIDDKARAEAPPSDWCYVFDFKQPSKPRALRLPTGSANGFRDAMERLVRDLHAAIPAAFETEEYRVQRRALDEELAERQEKAFEDVRQRAAGEDVVVLRTPRGFVFAPGKGGEVIEPQAFEALPEEERRRAGERIEALQEALEQVIRELPKWRRETQQKVRDLNRSVTRAAVGTLIDELRAAHAELPDVVAYLDEVRLDVLDNADQFQSKESEAPMLLGWPVGRGDGSEAVLRRYRVNVLVDNGRSKGAPVVYEDLPTHDELVGRIDHVAQMGTLVTDFTLIKAGALHRANGGYLILDAARLLAQPFSWEALKRALRSREIRTESLGQVLSLVSTLSLQPEPIPLDVKVVLVGERVLFYLLHTYDPEFAKLFKVTVDLSTELEREADTDLVYARMLAGIVRREGLRPFTRDAVARVIERAARICGDAQRLSLQLRPVGDLLREADLWAGSAGRSVVELADVQHAIDEQEHRADRVRQRLHQEVLRGTQLISTTGAAVGQVNGISVVQLPGFGFGHPNRITARVRMGVGKLVDIEREVELGGPVHSKGVLILGGFLAGRYAPGIPLALAATLVFEQSYGGVEGDSASSAELCALLSSLADAPIRQGFAVTGSVNQLGEVQAVGGVNEKIEGFYAICRARGLTGEQGVLIPAANVQHLMLSQDVIQSVAEGRFQIHAVSHVDQGLELLTGLSAGTRDATGAFPHGSLNQRVERRLIEFAEQARAFRTASREDPRL
jgi:lon-related putative ATP-dependent protease